jgi:co-chaperonin GroES (HSP10)
MTNNDTTYDIHHDFAEGPRAPNCPLLAVCDYVIIEPDAAFERSLGGIILPERDVSSDHRRAWTGWVRAVGPGLHLRKNGHRIPVDSMVGMHVAYDLRSFLAVELEDGSVYHVIRDEGVWMAYDDPEGKLRIVRPIADAEGVIYT